MSRVDIRAASRLGQMISALVAHTRSLGLMLGAPLARIALALPFLRSGLTRWDGFLSVSPVTVFLFENQFKLHIFGHVFDLPAPDVLSVIVAVAELSLPVLLILGLATRVAALCLLLMTGMIQLVFPDGWANFHLYWAALAAAVMALGPGPLSLDYLLSRKSRSRLRS